MSIASIPKLLRKNLQLSTCLAQRSKRNGTEPNYIQFLKTQSSLQSSALVQSQSKGSKLTKILTNSWVSSRFWEEHLVKNRRSSGRSDLLLRGGSAHLPCVLQHGWVCSGGERDGSVHSPCRRMTDCRLLHLSPTSSSSSPLGTTGGAQTARRCTAPPTVQEVTSQPSAWFLPSRQWGGPCVWTGPVLSNFFDSHLYTAQCNKHIGHEVTAG